MRRRFLAAGLAIIMTISSVPVNTLAEEQWESTQAEDIGDMLITDGAEEEAAQDITYEISESMTEAAESDDLMNVSEDMLDDVSDLENGILEDGFDLIEEDSLISVKEDIDEEETADGSFTEEDIAPDSLAGTEELSDDDGFLDIVDGSEESLEDGFLIADDEEADDYDEPMPEESETDSLQILEDYADDDKENVIDLEEEEEESAENLAFSDDSQDDSAFDNAEALQAGVPVTVELDEPGKRVVFSFTPNEGGDYIFKSQDISSGDPIGYLYDANRKLIAENDDSEGSNFQISKYLEEGETYYLQAADYDDSSAEYIVMVSRKPLSARAVGAEDDDPQNCYQTVTAGEEVTLEVEASAAAGEIYYRWYDPDFEEIEGKTGALCPIIATRTGKYCCGVSDDYGNEETVYFYITIDNSLTARAVGADDDNSTHFYQTVTAGEEITLEVEASATAGEIYYKWWYCPNYWTLIEGKTGALCTIIPSYTGEYRCEVSDEYGNEETIYFHITIDNSLSARAVGSDDDDPQSCYRTTVAGEEITLEVDASVAAGEIYYRWYDPDREEIEGKTGAMCPIIANRTGEYCCEVSDDYGNEETIYFYITIDNALLAKAVGGDEDDPQHCYRTVVAGEVITMEVEASVSEGEINYDWYDVDRVGIEGEQGASCTIIGHAGEYSCVVSDDYGNSVEVYFHIKVDNSFSVKAEGPDDEDPKYRYWTVAAGEEITLGVEASVAVGEIHYQWYDGDRIEGKTEESYTTRPTRSERYYCEVSDDYGNEETIYFYITIDNSLTVRAVGADDYMPTSFYQTVIAGEEITLEVEASASAGDIYYKWYGSGWDEIEGETGASYTIIANRTGEYRCEVSDDYGNEETVYFYITIDNSFTARAVGADEDDPQECYRTVSAGEEITLKVEASVAAGEIYYKWYGSDWDPIEGETGTSYTIISSHTETYRCEASDDYGNEETIYFNIMIENSLSARAVGADEEDPKYCYQTVKAEETITLEVEASVAAGEIYYKWYDPDRDEIEGETGASCTIIDSHTGRYRCEVSDDYGNEETVYFYITVDNSLSAWVLGGEDDSSQHCYLTVTAGEEKEITLEVEASAITGEIKYQWYDPDGRAINRAYESSYTLLPTNDGTYVCRVSDEYGNREEVCFTVKIDNSFIVKAAGARDDNPQYLYMKVSSEEIVTLKVEASASIGEITYEWYGPDGIIESETEASFSFVPKSSESYYCKVEDTYGHRESVDFYVEIDNSFEVKAVGADEEEPLYLRREIALGDEITLEVEASAARGDLSYQWCVDYYWDLIPIEGETGTSYKVAPSRGTWYYCVVTDIYGNSKTVEFYVAIANSLTAKAVGAKESDPHSLYVKVHPGEEVTFAVEASAEEGELYYEWYGVVGYQIAGGYDPFYTCEPSVGRYRCRVVDIYGNGISITFYVSIDNFLMIKAEGAQADDPKHLYKRIRPEEKATFKVEATVAEGEISYQWYDPNDNEIKGETGPTYTVQPGNSERYTCEVWDEYGNVETVIFDVIIEDTCNHETDGGKITKAPTCTAPGEKTYACKKCGEVLRKESIPAAGHKAVADAAVAATCTTAGKSAGTHCSVCGTVITAQKTIPATGHKWDAGKVTKEPTDKEEGIVTYTCSGCKGTKTEHLPKLSAEEAQKNPDEGAADTMSVTSAEKAEGDSSDPTSVAGAEKAMTAVKDSGEPAGSSFAAIQLQSKKQSKNSISLSWNKVKGATGYIVYGNRCGTKYKLARLAKQKKNTFTYKKLKKGTYYKFSVAAYKIEDGKEQVIGSSKMIHVATAGGKVTNVKSVTVTVKKKNVKKLALKTKKSAKLVAKVTAQNKKAKLKKHRVIKYESSNPKIAKVNAKGKVTAKKKGKCFIYVYSQNGVFAKVTVNVK